MPCLLRFYFVWFSSYRAHVRSCFLRLFVVTSVDFTGEHDLRVFCSIASETRPQRDSNGKSLPASRSASFHYRYNDLPLAAQQLPFQAQAAPQLVNHNLRSVVAPLASGTICAFSNSNRHLFIFLPSPAPAIGSLCTLPQQLQLLQTICSISPCSPFLLQILADSLSLPPGVDFLPPQAHNSIPDDSALPMQVDADESKATYTGSGRAGCFSCPLCHSTCSCARLLDRHIVRKHADDAPKFVQFACYEKQCQMPYSSAETLAAHRYRKHRDKFPDPPPARANRQNHRLACNQGPRDLKRAAASHFLAAMTTTCVT